MVLWQQKKPARRQRGEFPHIVPIWCSTTLFFHQPLWRYFCVNLDTPLQTNLDIRLIGGFYLMYLKLGACLTVKLIVRLDSQWEVVNKLSDTNHSLPYRTKYRCRDQSQLTNLFSWCSSLHISWNDFGYDIAL